MEKIIVSEIWWNRNTGRTVILVILALAIQAGSADAVTQINSCTTISSAGEYVLTRDIINSTSGACIKIISGNVVFDGAGHTIDGIDTFTKAIPSYGVHVNNPMETPTNVTVKNLRVTDWDSGIFYQDAAFGFITNNTANSNDIGIYLLSSGNITLAGNIANSNINGIGFYSSNYNMVADNAGNLNSKNGFFFYTSTYNTFINNTASSNCRNGIYLDSSGGNSLSANRAILNSESGIRLDASVRNTLAGNTAGSNGESGIYLSPLSNNNLLAGNTANNNLYGIILGDSHNNIITDNYVRYNSNGGIYLGDSGDNTLNNNTETSDSNDPGTSSSYNGPGNPCSGDILPPVTSIATVDDPGAGQPFDQKNRKVPDPQYISNENYSGNFNSVELLRLKFGNSIEQMLDNISNDNKIPRERLHVSTANTFVYRYVGQETTQYSVSMIEYPFWIVEVMDNESGIVYEGFIQDGASIHTGRIMTDEQSRELASYFKKYGKFESDLYNALLNMKENDWIDVIIWPAIVYPPDLDPDDYIPETTVEYFMQIKGYGFTILEPLVYGADVSEEMIHELEQRNDIENITAGRKAGNNTHIIMRIKPTIVDAQITSLEKFILDKTAGITFMKPVFFAGGLTKETVLELNNRTDVQNIAMQHTFHEAAEEENDAVEGRIAGNDSGNSKPEVPGFEMILGFASVLVMWQRSKKQGV